MKKLLLAGLLGILSIGCAKAKPQEPRQPEASKPKLVLTVSPAIIVNQVGYGKFTARMLNGEPECYQIIWDYGDGLRKEHEYPPEPFRTSQVIHLYRTGDYTPKLYLQCLSGTFIAETRIVVGSKNR
jgi:hypothetical protein